MSEKTNYQRADELVCALGSDYGMADMITAVHIALDEAERRARQSVREVYVVTANSDSTEGRGIDVIKYICPTEESALLMSKGLGPMGMSDGRVTMTPLVRNHEDVKVLRKEEARQRALSKLTKEDREALGIQ